MKKEDMYNSISNIRKDFLEEAEGYHAARKIHWKRWIAAAACFVLLLCAALPMFPGNETANPFVITAYAMDENGELTGTPIEISQGAPMTQVELSTGKGGFLFSIDLEDKNEESQMLPFALEEVSRSAEIEEVIEKYTEATGKAYFYFIPDDEVNEDGAILSVAYGFTKPDKSVVVYDIQIIKDNGVFTAKLMDVTQYSNEMEWVAEQD